MKRHTTYPTTHPHWIDVDEEQPKKRACFGISFTAAFAIVLGLHMAGIAGIFAYSQAKPKRQAVTLAKPAAMAAAGPASDALSRNEWPQPEELPKIVAESPVAVGSAPPPLKEPTAPTKTVAKPAASVREGDLAALKKAFLEARGGGADGMEARGEASAAATIQAVVSQNEAIAPREPVVPPTRAAAQAVAVHSSGGRSARPGRPAEYTLAAGDNLYMVSRRLQVSYDELMRANGLTDPRQLRVGQTLVVPES